MPVGSLSAKPALSQNFYEENMFFTHYRAWSGWSLVVLEWFFEPRNTEKRWKSFLTWHQILLKLTVLTWCHKRTALCIFPFRSTKRMASWRVQECSLLIRLRVVSSVHQGLELELTFSCFCFFNFFTLNLGLTDILLVCNVFVFLFSREEKRRWAGETGEREGERVEGDGGERYDRHVSLPLLQTQPFKIS